MGYLGETLPSLANAIVDFALHYATSPYEGRLGLVLPLPPSTNHLYCSQVFTKSDGSEGIRRVKTEEYNNWIGEAGYAPTTGRWHRFTEQKNDPRPWVLAIVAVGMNYQRDVSNLYKPTEDLVAQMTGLQDRRNRGAVALRLDQEGKWESGLYVLVEEV